jgi:hypothetical protein
LAAYRATAARDVGHRSPRLVVHLVLRRPARKVRGRLNRHSRARVAHLAGPGEILVSRTVRDLVAGSGLRFAERGDHELRGVPERWPIYAVA